MPQAQRFQKVKQNKSMDERFRVNESVAGQRFIPARAGDTLHGMAVADDAPVHPRPCGGHSSMNGPR